MQININLTEEQTKALLTEYVDIEEYASRVVINRANRLIEVIVKKYADKLEGVTEEEQEEIDQQTKGKIIIKAEDLPKKIKEIIVRRAKVKSMAERIAEQEEIPI